ncbi:unnamed protein product [Notodromas monacha]|uniref:Uncharacterized protein n=1 Tax=Notodromas monacha TaxID=399045 RepID=A0A7R9BXI7_9CRUS|nr:unnamed protein product [Notodromas monacha]CAG0922230.1 unnamed protein product [Notodromas monacha]
MPNPSLGLLIVCSLAWMLHAKSLTEGDDLPVAKSRLLVSHNNGHDGGEEGQVKKILSLFQDFIADESPERLKDPFPGKADAKPNKAPARGDGKETTAAGGGPETVATDAPAGGDGLTASGGGAASPPPEVSGPTPPDGAGPTPPDGAGPTPPNGAGPTPPDGAGPTPPDGAGPTPPNGAGPLPTGGSEAPPSTADGSGGEVVGDGESTVKPADETPAAKPIPPEMAQTIADILNKLDFDPSADMTLANMDFEAGSTVPASAMLEPPATIGPLDPNGTLVIILSIDAHADGGTFANYLNWLVVNVKAVEDLKNTDLTILPWKFNQELQVGDLGATFVALIITQPGGDFDIVDLKTKVTEDKRLGFTGSLLSGDLYFDNIDNIFRKPKPGLIIYTSFWTVCPEEETTCSPPGLNGLMSSISSTSNPIDEMSSTIYEIELSDEDITSEKEGDSEMLVEEQTMVPEEWQVNTLDAFEEIETTMSTMMEESNEEDDSNSEEDEDVTTESPTCDNCECCKKRWMPAKATCAPDPTPNKCPCNPS